jgi:hypothetical protein
VSDSSSDGSHILLRQIDTPQGLQLLLLCSLSAICVVSCVFKIVAAAFPGNCPGQQQQQRLGWLLCIVLQLCVTQWGGEDFGAAAVAGVRRQPCVQACIWQAFLWRCPFRGRLYGGALRVWFAIYQVPGVLTLVAPDVLVSSLCW